MGMGMILLWWRLQRLPLLRPKLPLLGLEQGQGLGLGVGLGQGGIKAVLLVPGSRRCLATMVEMIHCLVVAAGNLATAAAQH